MRYHSLSTSYRTELSVHLDSYQSEHEYEQYARFRSQVEDQIVRLREVRKDTSTLKHMNVH